MISLEFVRNGGETTVLDENDLFDFRFERGCFSGDSFELGGVNSNVVYLVIDNNDGRFPRGSFANSRLTLYIDGTYCGQFNTELPKRRNGVIELTAYDDMIKLDCEFPSTVGFPQTFWQVYAYCVQAAGLASDFSFDNCVLNALFNNGVISHEYTDYIYANSCRNLVSGMAEWNGGFAYINNDGKLQVDVFSKDVKKTFRSGDLMAFDYSDETVTFSKIKTSQKNKTYEKGDDSGYTLVVRNQYISYGLSDEAFETYFGIIHDYYNGFSLTPMTFTLAEPDFTLNIGDRISVVDEEENVTVTGNISKIVVRGNCSMEITCGGFGNVGSASNYKPTSLSQTTQAKTEAKGSGGGGVGKASDWDNTSEYFNDYEGNHAGNKDKRSGTAYYAAASGKGTKATGMFSFAANFGSEASGQNSAAFNFQTKSPGWCASAFGYQTTASGPNSACFGQTSTAAAPLSFCFGSDCTINGGGTASMAVGSRHTVNSSFSFAGGVNCTVNHDRCFVFGENLRTARSYQVVFGCNNDYENSKDCLLVVGTDYGYPTHNNFTVDKYGNVTCAGTLKCASVITSDAGSVAALNADNTAPEIYFIDHVPTADDKKGAGTLLVQYDPDPDSTGLCKIVGAFYEKG